MKPDLTKYNKDIAELCAKYHVSSLYQFGSSMTDKFNSESDFDIIVVFDDVSLTEYSDNYFSLKHDLEKLFGRKVDLIEEEVITNPYLAEKIAETKTPLYEH